jgi:hypothetical protein
VVELMRRAPAMREQERRAVVQTRQHRFVRRYGQCSVPRLRTRFKRSSDTARPKQARRSDAAGFGLMMQPVGGTASIDPNVFPIKRAPDATRFASRPQPGSSTVSITWMTPSDWKTFWIVTFET